MEVGTLPPKSLINQFIHRESSPDDVHLEVTAISMHDNSRCNGRNITLTDVLPSVGIEVSYVAWKAYNVAVHVNTPIHYLNVSCTIDLLSSVAALSMVIQ